MFTGIIEGLGTIRAIRRSAQGARVALDADFSLEGTRIGDSICVNGACLTVVRLEGRRFEADMSPETLARTTFGSAGVGERVNLERALRLSDRLDGHLVSGHVDGTGKIACRTPSANAVVIDIKTGAGLLRYMIEKGSVAVDGISLTINRCEPDRFTVSVIPQTAAVTTIGFKPVGAAVNIEPDLIGKYVERFLPGRSSTEPAPSSGGLNIDFLAKTGFLK